MAWLTPGFSGAFGLESGLPGGGDPGGSLRIANCNFQLLIEDVLTGVFYSLSGGEIEVGLIKHDVVFESGSSSTLFIPGPTSFSPFTLSRGFADYVNLYNWLMAASNGDIIRARRNGTIKMHRNATSEDVDNRIATKVGEWVPVLQWHFDKAWPTKLASFGSFLNDGTTTAIARVSVTLVAESISYERITV
jgi:phage tail-like protein